MPTDASELTIFLAGDVMTGRGIDQVLPNPGDPELRETVVHDARDYVALAESVNGRIPRPVDPSWPWGDALALLDDADPDVRVINLETSVTTSDAFAPGKGINYRMHPHNIGCLTVARPDVCALGNNHVLDFGREGLLETLETLDSAGIAHAGAGRDAAEAHRPAVVRVGRRRVRVYAVGSGSSGVPESWAATDRDPGVAHLPDLSAAAADAVLSNIEESADSGDVVVVSVHAGSNWGYRVPRSYRQFARRLVDGGVAVVHGHSSHHPRPIEMHRGGLVLYGCGDLINDYEGIGGREDLRAELRLLYLVTLDVDAHSLRELRLVPVRARRFRLERATREDVEWLQKALDRISRPFGTRVDGGPDGTLLVRSG